METTSKDRFSVYQASTLAWPLAWVYALLIVYASWYPFTGWRPVEHSSWAFIGLAFPRYWTGFDIVTNVLGYVPLGFFFGLSALRLSRGWRGISGMIWTVLFVAALSLVLEWGQNYLPSRVPSNLDWFLNILGGLTGIALAWQMEALGAISRWSLFRRKWFSKDSNGVLALIILWPFALLFPTPVAFAPGQVLERLFNSASYFLFASGWISSIDALGDFQIHALSSYSITFCAFVGILTPTLLGMSIIQGVGKRAVFLFVAIGGGCLISSLSSALSYGPNYPLVWLTTEVVFAIIMAAILCAFVLSSPFTTHLLLLILLLPMMLLIINQAPHDPYFALTLQTWEQGRFVRFHGLAQYIGWVWPYAVLFLSVKRLLEFMRASHQDGV